MYPIGQQPPHLTPGLPPLPPLPIPNMVDIPRPQQVPDLPPLNLFSDPKYMEALARMREAKKPATPVASVPTKGPGPAKQREKKRESFQPLDLTVGLKTKRDAESPLDLSIKTTRRSADTTAELETSLAEAKLKYHEGLNARHLPLGCDSTHYPGRNPKKEKLLAYEQRVHQQHLKQMSDYRLFEASNPMMKAQNPAAYHALHHNPALRAMEMNARAAFVGQHSPMMHGFPRFPIPIASMATQMMTPMPGHPHYDLSRHFMSAVPREQTTPTRDMKTPVGIAQPRTHPQRPSSAKPSTAVRPFREGSTPGKTTPHTPKASPKPHSPVRSDGKPIAKPTPQVSPLPKLPTSLENSALAQQLLGYRSYMNGNGPVTCNRKPPPGMSPPGKCIGNMAVAPGIKPRERHHTASSQPSPQAGSHLRVDLPPHMGGLPVGVAQVAPLMKQTQIDAHTELMNRIRSHLVAQQDSRLTQHHRAPSPPTLPKMADVKKSEQVVPPVSVGISSSRVGGGGGSSPLPSPQMPVLSPHRRSPSEPAASNHGMRPSGKPPMDTIDARPNDVITKQEIKDPKAVALKNSKIAAMSPKMKLKLEHKDLNELGAPTTASDGGHQEAQDKSHAKHVSNLSAFMPTALPLDSSVDKNNLTVIDSIHNSIRKTILGDLDLKARSSSLESLNRIKNPKQRPRSSSTDSLKKSTATPPDVKTSSTAPGCEIEAEIAYKSSLRMPPNLIFVSRPSPPPTVVDKHQSKKRGRPRKDATKTGDGNNVNKPKQNIDGSKSNQLNSDHKLSKAPGDKTPCQATRGRPKGSKRSLDDESTAGLKKRRLGEAKSPSKHREDKLGKRPRADTPEGKRHVARDKDLQRVFTHRGRTSSDSPDAKRFKSSRSALKSPARLSGKHDGIHRRLLRRPNSRLPGEEDDSDTEQTDDRKGKYRRTRATAMKVYLRKKRGLRSTRARTGLRDGDRRPRHGGPGRRSRGLRAMTTPVSYAEDEEMSDSELSDDEIDDAVDCRIMPRIMKKMIVNKNSGETVLHRAARLGYEDVVLFCLETGHVDVNVRDNAGYTPLHECAVRGYVNIAQTLVVYGADVDCSSSDGTRPIHGAVDNDHRELVRLLLSYGADPILATYAGKTPESLARSPKMKAFLSGYLNDINGVEESENPVIWEFPGSSDVIEMCSNDDDEFGFNIFSDVPSDPDDDEHEILFEFSAETHVTSYRLCLEGDGGPRNYVILAEVMEQLSLTRQQFLARCANIILKRIPLSAFRRQVSQSVVQELPASAATPGRRGPAYVELLRLDDRLRDLLAITVITTNDLKEDVPESSQHSSKSQRASLQRSRRGSLDSSVSAESSVKSEKRKKKLSLSKGVVYNDEDPSKSTKKPELCDRLNNNVSRTYDILQTVKANSEECPEPFCHNLGNRTINSPLETNGEGISSQQDGAAPTTETPEVCLTVPETNIGQGGSPPSLT